MLFVIIYIFIYEYTLNLLICFITNLQVPLEVTAALDCKKLNGLKLSLSGDHQYTNAGLAVSLCKSWLRSTGNWEKVFQHVSENPYILQLFVLYIEYISPGFCTDRKLIVLSSENLWKVN